MYIALEGTLGNRVPFDDIESSQLLYIIKKFFGRSCYLLHFVPGISGNRVWRSE